MEFSLLYISLVNSKSVFKYGVEETFHVDFTVSLFLAQQYARRQYRWRINKEKKNPRVVSPLHFIHFISIPVHEKRTRFPKLRKE